VYKDLEKVYADNATPYTVKKGIVDRIQSELASEGRCDELGSKPVEDGAGMGQAMLGIAILWPIALPIAAYGLLVEYPNEQWQYKRVSDELRLGRPLKDFPKWFTKELKAVKKGEYTVHEFVQKRAKTILYFENGKLDAWSVVQTAPRSF